MPTSKAAAIVLADKGSLVVSDLDDPNIVIKHIDGAMMRLSPLKNDEAPFGNLWHVQFRHELDVTWNSGGAHGTLSGAVLELTDAQAFGMREGDETVTLATYSDRPRAPGEICEIESLDQGAVLVDSEEHLPVTLHLRTGEYWRARRMDVHPKDLPTENEPGEEGFHEADGTYVIERKRDDVGSWEIEETYSTGDDMEFPTLIERLSEKAGIPIADSPSAKEIEATIEEVAPSFDQAW